MNNLTVGNFLAQALSELEISHLFTTVFLDKTTLDSYKSNLPNFTLISAPLSIMAATHAAATYSELTGFGACVFPDTPSNRLQITTALLNNKLPLSTLIILTRPLKNGNLSCQDTFTQTAAQKLSEHFCEHYTITPHTGFNSHEFSNLLNHAQRRQKTVCLQVSVPLNAHLSGKKALIHPEKTFDCDNLALTEALNESYKIISTAPKTLIIVGRLLQNPQLKQLGIRFIEKTSFPFLTLPCSKALIPESHPQFLGVYQKNQHAHFHDHFMETTTLLCLGVETDDIDSLESSSLMKKCNIIKALPDCVKIQHHHYQHVVFYNFLFELASLFDLKNLNDEYHMVADDGSFQYTVREVSEKKSKRLISKHKTSPFNGATYDVSSHQELTPHHFYSALTDFLKEGDVFIVDENLIDVASQIQMPDHSKFLILRTNETHEFTFSATIAVSCADKYKRVIVLIDDGQFQSNCAVLAYLLKHQWQPIFIVIEKQPSPSLKTIKIKHAPTCSLTDLLPHPQYLVVSTASDLDIILKKLSLKPEIFILGVCFNQGSSGAFFTHAEQSSETMLLQRIKQLEITNQQLVSKISTLSETLSHKIMNND